MDPAQTEQADKSTDAAKTDAKAEPGKAVDGKAPVVPEKYEAFKTPEGFKLEDAAAADAGTLFKELGLTQDQAQKAIDLYAKYAKDSTDQSVKSMMETRQGWKDQATKSFGKDIEPGGKIVVGLGRMLDSLGDPQLVKDFKQVMNLTGAGDHPAFIGVFKALVERLGEGTAVNGTKPSAFGQTAPGTGRKSAANEIYPNLS